MKSKAASIVQPKRFSPPPEPKSKPVETTLPTAPTMSAGSGAPDDIWGSPEMHAGHNHVNTKTNGNSYRAGEVDSLASPQIIPSRPSYSQTPSQAGNDDLPSGLGLPRQPSMNAWGVPPSAGGFVDTQNDSGSIAGSSLRPTFGSASRGPGGLRVEEVITITALADKEGMFMFQHRNYQVASSRRGSRVIRRYSDFVWLLDCLQKRYPFRQLPILPPKRLAGKLFIHIKLVMKLGLRDLKVVD